MNRLALLNIFDLIFPQICINCGSKINYQENYLCNDCFSKIHFFSDNFCKRCGGLKTEFDCEICENNEFLFDRARSAFQLNPVISRMIHLFKYEKMTSLGKFLAELTSEYVKKSTPYGRVDLIIPAPLHTVKKRIRGFNQAEILSSVIGKNLKYEHIPDLIFRKRFTETQTKLNRNKRIKNVSNAFITNKKYSIIGKNVLIIDDVFTTGSTVNAISNTLKNNGAGSVFVLTVARA